MRHFTTVFFNFFFNRNINIRQICASSSSQMEYFFGATIGGFFLKVYEQIIAGIWSVVLLLPVETVCFRIEGVSFSGGYTTLKYTVFAVLFSLFFVASSFILPYVKRYNLKKTMVRCAESFNLSQNERQQFLSSVNNSIECYGLFTKNGLWRFANVILVNIAGSACFFMLEDSIAFFSGASPSIFPSFVFAIVFIAASLFGKLLGRKYAKMYGNITDSLINSNYAEGEEGLLEPSIMGVDGDYSHRFRMQFSTKHLEELSNLVMCGICKDEVGGVAVTESMLNVVKLLKVQNVLSRPSSQTIHGKI